MKKTVFFILFLLIIPVFAFAELSTNLNVRTIMAGNSKWMVDRRTYVDSDGKVAVPTDKGYATVKYTYEGRNVVKEEFLDENGRLVNCVDGYASKVNHYKGKKLIDSEYHDVHGKLVNGPDGYARQVITYFQGKHKSTWNYDPEGNPVGTHQISEYKPYMKIYLLVSDSWYDTDNHLAPGTNGYARVEYEYEGKTRSKVSYLSEDGTPYYYKKTGYATMISKYHQGRIQSTH